MSLPAPDFVEPTLDLSSVEPETVPTEDFGVPDHTASRTERRKGLRALIGDTKPKSDEEKPARKAAPRAAKKAAPRPKKGQFVEPLIGLYTMVGTMLMPIDQVCGQAVIMSAQQCAESLDELAFQNEAVRKALVALTQTSAMGAVIMAHAPIIIAITMHHMPGFKEKMGAMSGLMGAVPEPQNV